MNINFHVFIEVDSYNLIFIINLYFSIFEHLFSFLILPTDTCIGVAILGGAQLKVIKAISDANPNAVYQTNNYGMIPIAHAASVSSCTEVFEFLLEKTHEILPESIELLLNSSLTGISTDVMENIIIKRLGKSLLQLNNNGWSILHILLLRNAPVQQVRSFIKAVPESVRLVNESNALPIHYSCLYGSNIKVIQLMINEYPESLFIPDMDGNLPLHLACWCGSSFAVVNLLFHLMKADPTTDYMFSRNGSGETPLHLGFRRSYPDVSVIRLLVGRSNQLLRVRNNKGLAPIDYAREYHFSNRDLIELCQLGDE